ncbi:MAG: hypothetical protein AAB933_00305 [Patescibacteria group bacterium]
MKTPEPGNGSKENKIPTEQKPPEGFKTPEGLSTPFLPPNVNQNEIFKSVPELFTSSVDSFYSPNHWNENGFFSKLVVAGLTIESLRLETGSGGRQVQEITDFEILPQKDAIRIKAKDGREFQLRIKKYRINPDLSPDALVEPMKNLDSVDIFSVTDDIEIMLSFTIRKLTR